MQLDHDFKPELDHGHLGDQFACLIGILVVLRSGVNHDQEWWPGQSLWHSTSDVKFRNPRTLNVSSKLQSCSSPRSPWPGWQRVPPGWRWCGSGSWSSLWLKCKRKLWISFLRLNLDDNASDASNILIKSPKYTKKRSAFDVSKYLSTSWKVDVLYFTSTQLSANYLVNFKLGLQNLISPEKFLNILCKVCSRRRENSLKPLECSTFHHQRSCCG